MTDSQILSPPQQLATTNKAHYPDESPEYRSARNVLLAEEIELRRHIERVAAQRRALPIGGKLAKDFELVSEAAPTRLSAFFGDKKTLMVYSMMYGPQRMEWHCCQPARTRWHCGHRPLADRASRGVQATASVRKPSVRVRSYR